MPVNFTEYHKEVGTAFLLPNYVRNHLASTKIYHSIKTV